jgi:hypothetical protein
MAFDEGARAAFVTARRRDTLVLTLPADPELAQLTRLVSTHFFRQSGLTAAAARRGAQFVEKRCRPLLRLAARRERGGGAGLILHLRPQAAAVAVYGRAGRGPETCLLRITLPDPS